MKHFTKQLGVILFVFMGFNLNAQIQTGPTSSSNACDGWAALDSTLVYDSWSWLQSDSTTVVQTGGYYLSNLCYGYYYFSYTDSNGTYLQNFFIDSTSTSPCSTFSVSIDSMMNATANGVCDGYMIANVSGGTPNYTYTWSNGEVTASIANLCAGSYTLTVADANNCTATATASVTEPADSTTNCANFGIEILSVTNTSDFNSCDGSASVQAFGSDGSETFIWNNNEVGSVVDGLCAGSYSVTATDSMGCTATVSVYVYSDSSSVNTPLNGYVYTTDVSADGVCDGTVYVEMYGGTSPYNYDHSSGAATQNATGLCAGLHSVVVTDSEGDTLVLNYVIASPSNIIDNNNFTDSTYIDTLTTDLLENCLLNYAAIDSAFISGIDFVTADSIVVTWTVMDANGSITITDSYTLTLGYGIYEFILELFCPQRGGNDYLVAKDDILIDPSSLSIQEAVNDLVNVYPNPFTSSVTIDLKNANKASVTVTDLTGKIVYQGSHAGKSIVLNTEQFTAGHYFVQVATANGSFVRKMVK